MPFTEDQFFEIFHTYNSSVGFSIVLLYCLGIAALVLHYRRAPVASRFSFAALTFVTQNNARRISGIML